MGNGGGIDLHDLFARLNRYGLWNVEVGLFPTGNVRATNSAPNEARSESCIAINRKDSSNLVGASKKFIDPAIYLHKLGPIYTFDGGDTWHESTLPMQPGWDGMTDPTVAYDRHGHAFLVGEPETFDHTKVGTSGDVTGHGMYVYRTSDGGKTWEQPKQLTTDTTDDKQWVVCDTHPSSPHYGNVYVAWGAAEPLKFARSTDHGVTWTGRGADPPGSLLVPFSYAPDLSVSADGTLHIMWHNEGGTTINYIRSTDGGNTFEPQQTIVSGLTSLRNGLPITDGWPHFDHGKFRVITIATSCAGSGGVVVVAWADIREGRSRIYYRRSLDHGATWEGPASGQPLLPTVSFGDTHCFHPQIQANGTGVIGCAYYTFGLEAGQYLINVQLAASWDDAATFSDFVTVTEQGWDPLLHPPFSHGDPNVHFIGEYFGLDADHEDFALLWTDTRTGYQELWSDVVRTKRVQSHGPRIPELAATIIAGVVQDGGGWIIVGGKLIRVPPRGPVFEALIELAARAERLEEESIEEEAP
jgi:hypothetical protein